MELIGDGSGDGRAVLPALGWKTRAAAALTSAPVQRFLRGRTVRYGRCRSVRLTCDGAHVGRGTGAAVAWGLYEAAEFRSLKACLPRDLPVVELGAGIGVVTACMLRLGFTGPITSVEPDERLHGILTVNVRRNNTQGVDWRLVSAGVGGGRASTAALHRDPQGHLGSRLVETVPRRGDEVATMTLSRITEGLQRYVLVSDIEGAEAHFILGEDAALARCQAICIELHDTSWEGRAVSKADLEVRLREAGFARVRADGSVRVFVRT